MIEKQLFIGDCIAEIDNGSKRRKPYIKIIIQNKYCPDVCEKLLQGLTQQMLNSWGKMPIRALTLVWDEYEEDFEERNK